MSATSGLRPMEAGGIHFQVKPPVIDGANKVILLLHGWTGDEQSMWIFSQRLPQDAWMIAPRGFFPAPFGGYSWHAPNSGVWPTVGDIKPSIERLIEVITPRYFPDILFLSPSMTDVQQRPLYLVGFSQGAALAFTFPLFYPQLVGAVAGLSGFVPADFEHYSQSLPYNGIPVLLAHGSLDELVPVEKARQAVELLTRAGGQVDYCEDAVGHKLSAACFRSLEIFFRELST